MLSGKSKPFKKVVHYLHFVNINNITINFRVMKNKMLTLAVQKKPQQKTDNDIYQAKIFNNNVDLYQKVSLHNILRYQ